MLQTLTANQTKVWFDQQQLKHVSNLHFMVKHGDFTRTIALDENSFSDRGTSIIKATNVKFV